MNIRVVVAFALAFLPFVAAAQQHEQPQVTIEANRVTASHFHPGARVVLYAVSLVSDGYSSGSRAFNALLTDDDHDGAITYSSAKPVALRSIWVAVDLDTGEYAVGTPSGYGTTQPGRHAAFRKSNGGTVDVVAAPSLLAYVLYVRPGQGAWTTMAIDGGVGDFDQASDGIASLSLGRFKSVDGTSPAPASLLPGGALFIIDEAHMTTEAVTLTADMLNGAN